MRGGDPAVFMQCRGCRTQRVSRCGGSVPALGAGQDTFYKSGFGFAFFDGVPVHRPGDRFGIWRSPDLARSPCWVWGRDVTATPTNVRNTPFAAA